MNTADIRNTTRDQGLFWAIAMPVTVLVLATAFVYGYRGDAIAELLDEKIESWQVRRRLLRARRLTAAIARARGGPGDEGDGLATLGGEKSPRGRARRGSSRSRWFAETLKRTRHGSMGSKSGIRRRATDDSLVV